MSKLQVVTGGQFGSESKGACTAFLARKGVTKGLTSVIRVAGPNAGHTAYDDQGRKWALRQVPAAVVVPGVELYIGAGSEIEFAVLLDEITRLEEAGIPVRDRLTVDPQATMIDYRHKAIETDLIGKIGSTGKGIGAARAERLMRQAATAGDQHKLFDAVNIDLNTTSMMFYDLLQGLDHTLIIEGTQGYGLGLHAGYYPQCTSSDCRSIDFLSMAGIDPLWAGSYEPWVVLRTYPIRVAGNSGPMKGETSWAELGFEPELTTVTQKVRRVGNWDPDLARAAVIANGGSAVQLSLSMVDYVLPGLANAVTIDESDENYVALTDLIHRVQEDAGARVSLIGTGPETFIEWGLM